MKLFRDLVGALGVVIFTLSLLSPVESSGCTPSTRTRCIDGHGANMITCDSPECRLPSGQCTTQAEHLEGQEICWLVRCDGEIPECICTNTVSGCRCQR
jgi:hypothetical protein